MFKYNYNLQQLRYKKCILRTTYQINKPKIVRFLKNKFLTVIKLNFNGGQFYKKILNFDYLKKRKFCIKQSLKLKMVNICVEKYESKILSEFKLNRYKDKLII